MAKFEKSNYRQSSQVNIVPINETPKNSGPVSENFLEVCKICCILKGVCHRLQGVGLSAVQVGLPLNIYVIKTKSDYECYIDCSYSPIDDLKITTLEGCLSIRNQSGDFKTFKVERHKKVRLVGKKLSDFKLLDVDEELEGQLAVIHQHECDHADGIFISDIGEQIEYRSL